MAVEILIFNRLSHYDEMSFEELQNKRLDSVFDKEYEARYQIGDPVAVYEGPHFKTLDNPGGKNFNKLKFVVLILPNLEYNQAVKIYLDEHQDETGSVLKTRKYKIDISIFSFTDRMAVENDNLKFIPEDKTKEAKK